MSKLICTDGRPPVWISADGHGAVCIDTHPRYRDPGEFIELTTLSRLTKQGFTIALPVAALPGIVAALVPLCSEIAELVGQLPDVTELLRRVDESWETLVIINSLGDNLVEFWGDNLTSAATILDDLHAALTGKD